MDDECTWLHANEQDPEARGDSFPSITYPPSWGATRHPTRRYSHFSLDQEEAEDSYFELEHNSDGETPPETHQDDHTMREETEQDEVPQDGVGQDIILQPQTSHPLMNAHASPIRPAPAEPGSSGRVRFMNVRYVGDSCIKAPFRIAAEQKFLVTRDYPPSSQIDVKAKVTLETLKQNEPTSRRSPLTNMNRRSSKPKDTSGFVKSSSKLKDGTLDDQPTTQVPQESKFDHKQHRKSALRKNLQASPSSEDSTDLAKVLSAQEDQLFGKHSSLTAEFSRRDRIRKKAPQEHSPKGNGSDQTMEESGHLGKRRKGTSESAQSAPASMSEPINPEHAVLVSGGAPNKRLSGKMNNVVPLFKQKQRLLGNRDADGPSYRATGSGKATTDSSILKLGLWRNHQERKIKSKLEDVIGYWQSEADRQTPIIFKCLCKETTGSSTKLTKMVDLSKRKLSMNTVLPRIAAPPQRIRPSNRGQKLRASLSSRKKPMQEVIHSQLLHRDLYTNGPLNGLVRISPKPQYVQQTLVAKRTAPAQFHLRNITAESDEGEQ